MDFDKSLADPDEIAEYLLQIRLECNHMLNRVVGYYARSWIITWDGKMYNVWAEGAYQL